MDFVKFRDSIEQHGGGAFSRFVLRAFRKDPTLSRKRPARFPVGKIYPYRWERELLETFYKYLERMAGEALEKAFKDGEKVLDEAGTVKQITSTIDGGGLFIDSITEKDKSKNGPYEKFISRLSEIAESICTHAENIFSEWSELTVGAPFIPETKTAAIRRDWVKKFQLLCESANTETKNYIANEIWTAKQQGQNKREIYKAVENQYKREIQIAQSEARKSAIKKEMEKEQAKQLSKAYDKLKADISKGLKKKIRNKAELVARTETGKLNQAATRATHEAAGVDYYEWITTMDGRERESHAKLNGLICSHNDPAAQYIENGENPEKPTKEKRPAGAYEGEPGEDFQCRCSCVPWIPVLNSKYRTELLEKMERW